MLVAPMSSPWQNNNFDPSQPPYWMSQDVNWTIGQADFNFQNITQQSQEMVTQMPLDQINWTYMGSPQVSNWNAPLTTYLPPGIPATLSSGIPTALPSDSFITSQYNLVPAQNSPVAASPMIFSRMMETPIPATIRSPKKMKRKASTTDSEDSQCNVAMATHQTEDTCRPRKVYISEEAMTARMSRMSLDLGPPEGTEFSSLCVPDEGLVIEELSDSDDEEMTSKTENDGPTLELSRELQEHLRRQKAVGMLPEKLVANVSDSKPCMALVLYKSPRYDGMECSSRRELDASGDGAKMKLWPRVTTSFGSTPMEDVPLTSNSSRLSLSQATNSPGLFTYQLSSSDEDMEL